MATSIRTKDFAWSLVITAVCSVALCVSTVVYISKIMDKETPTILEEAVGFSSDGSHAGLVKMTKAEMNDPDSFKHVSTMYSETEDGIFLRVVMHYSGKNALGGRVRGIKRATTSPRTGSVIKINRY